MSLIGIARNVINGTQPVADLESKLVDLAKTGADEALETIENALTSFSAKFLPAEASAIASDVPAAISNAVANGVTSALAALGTTLLSQTAANATSAAASTLGTNG